MPKKSKELSYNSKGINIIIKNDIKPYEEPIKSKPKQRRKRRNIKSNTTNNFLDKNNNQVVDSKIPIYRDLYNRNINNIPQPQMVDWQAVRLGLLPPPPQPPALPPPPPTQTPPMITNHFPAINYGDPFNGMAKIIDSMRPYFLTNNPYNFEDGGYTGPTIEEYTPLTQDIQIQQDVANETEQEIINQELDTGTTLTEEEKKILYYTKLEEKVAGFAKGRLKASGTMNSSKLNNPQYVFNQEYMNSYISNLENIKESIVDDLGHKDTEIRSIREKIRTETDDIVKDNLKSKIKKLNKEKSQIQKKIDKIADIDRYINKETDAYNQLFGTSYSYTSIPAPAPAPTRPAPTRPAPTRPAPTRPAPIRPPPPALSSPPPAAAFTPAAAPALPSPPPAAASTPAPPRPPPPPPPAAAASSSSEPMGIKDVAGTVAKISLAKPMINDVVDRIISNANSDNEIMDTTHGRYKKFESFFNSLVENKYKNDKDIIKKAYSVYKQKKNI